MGFGILIFGYFLMFAFSISQVYFFADIIGALIVMYAFSKIAEYNRYFIRAMWFCLAFLLFGAVNAVSLMFGIYDPSGNIALAVSILKTASAALMHIPMFLGIRGIADGAESVGLVHLSERNMTMSMIYYAAALLVIALDRAFGDYTQYAGALVWLFGIVCIFLNLVLFYKCFATLCPADENAHEKKRSRFRFINKINDKLDAIDEERQRYREESMKLAMEEADRRAAEKAKQNKHRPGKKKK